MANWPTTEMRDGARPVLTRMDRNEDGKLDRWEYYNPQGQLEKVGFSRKDDGKPDAWAFADADGKPDRRLTYQGSALVLIETEPDAAGNFTRRVEVK